MAIAKVCGIETEYGISTTGGDGNPIAASSVLVNAYATLEHRKTRWDFEDEAPGNDARGLAPEGTMAPLVETNLANTVLTNGARYYVDHAHPEYSTPECSNPLEAVLHDKAGEEVLRRSMAEAAAALSNGPRIVVYKNNSDGKGNTYGCHENYLMDRNLSFADIVVGIVPHFVTRQIFTGAGKVGVETSALDPERVHFQVSQRAEFFEEVVGLETTLKRPIVNTRDEPHADPKRFRRLHVIVGDANLSELSTLLKIGTTAVVLAMIEDRVSPARSLAFADPVRAIHQVSSDIELNTPLEMADGTRATALEVQWELFATASKYALEEGLDSIGDPNVASLVMDRWEFILLALESDPASLANNLDWIAKLELMKAYRERHGCSWSDSRLRALDLQYHDLRPERSLYARIGMQTLVDQDAINQAVHEPPCGTRAWFRGTCLARWPDAIATANWDSLVFDLGHDPLSRVPMMDPLKGTAELASGLLDGSANPAEMLKRLSS